MNRKQIAKEFAGGVIKRFGDKIEKIILFGSVARGDHNKDSDIDVLVIVKEEPFKMQRMISEIVINILLNKEEYISAKTLSVAEYEFQKKIDSGFFRSISKEGILIGRSGDFYSQGGNET
jgi:Predicted nucleotidyltransferases